MERKKIVYAGLDIETLFLLCNEDSFNVLSVGKIESFKTRTLNPVNWIFKAVYLLRIRDTSRPLEIFLICIWIIASPLSSAVFRKYAQYLRLISKKRIKVLDFDDSRTTDFIKAEIIDLIVVNAWGILPEAIVLAPRFGTVNIHPSKLPQYRGALPTLWALKNKDNETAVTYMLLDRDVDTGKIISRHVFRMNGNEDWLSMENKVADIIKKTLISDLKKYFSGELEPFSQDESVRSGTGRYMEYLKIDWREENAEDIYNKINLYPFLEPGLHCYFYLGKHKIEVKKAELSKGTVSMRPRKYAINGLNVSFQAKDDIIIGRLFESFSFIDSVKLIRLSKFSKH